MNRNAAPAPSAAWLDGRRYDKPFTSVEAAHSYLHGVIISAGAVMGISGYSVVPVLSEDADGNITRYAV